MAKGSILQDTFEQLTELGQSTAKKTVKSVAATFNPLSQTEKSSSDPQQLMKEQLKNKKDNHTPLDFNKLQESYKNNDSKKTDMLRQHLFNLVRRADQQILAESKQNEMQKKRQEAYVDAEKKRREAEKKKQQDAGDIPQGKTRKSIFSHKKVAEKQHAETKPSTGKQ